MGKIIDTCVTGGERFGPLDGQECIYSSNIPPPKKLLLRLMDPLVVKRHIWGLRFEIKEKLIHKKNPINFYFYLCPLNLKKRFLPPPLPQGEKYRWKYICQLGNGSKFQNLLWLLDILWIFLISHSVLLWHWTGSWFFFFWVVFFYSHYVQICRKKKTKFKRKWITPVE